MRIKLFLVVFLVYELTSSRVNELFVTIMIRVIRVIRSLLVYKLTS